MAGCALVLLLHQASAARQRGRGVSEQLVPVPARTHRTGHAAVCTYKCQHSEDARVQFTGEVQTTSRNKQVLTRQKRQVISSNTH